MGSKGGAGTDPRPTAGVTRGSSAGSETSDDSATSGAGAALLERLRHRIEIRRSRGQPVDRLEERLRQQLGQQLGQAAGSPVAPAGASRQRRSERRPPDPQRLAAIARAEPLEFPADLPITRQLDEIRTALAHHQVVVVAGETGSGKTTQLPKLCLAMGRGRSRRIAHTQPRRLAAQAVAARIASELGSPVGALVGFSVRFAAQLSSQSAIKLMTDGMLLAEIADDRWLDAYDTIILDEAHERSLNVDFLLGYLKRLLRRRSDMQVIITSATIDVEAFAGHFDDAPVVQIPGRTYPVEVVYRPPADNPGAAAAATSPALADEGLVTLIEEIERGKHGTSRARDVLVFLPGEGEIMDCARLLRRRRPDLDVLPLYARLPAKDQARVFSPGSRRRVVLATNVAETSITVPNIGFVIDPGVARVARYSLRSRLQRLPLEPIAQANARQRSGRCGRVAPGVCLRLYSEEDFDQRPPFLEPEIQRSNLANVVLQMFALGLGDIDSFPFMDPPDGRAVRDARRRLFELEALSAAEDGQLTATGTAMARLPVDPSLGRMLVEGERLGVLADVSVIVAALAVPDPRERSPERAAAAAAAHAGFADERSDFLDYLRLWQWFEEHRETLSGSRFRRACEQQFLSFMRLREWRNVHRQLRLKGRDLGWNVDPWAGPEEQRYERIHQALLPGLLRNLGHLQPGREYRGVSGVAFRPFPGTSLGRRTPKWIMAAEIIETRRVYASKIAPIEVEWVERAAAHLVKRSWSNPQWSRRRGEVRATERVSLGSLALVENRRGSYTRHDPLQCRELLLRDALVAGEIDTRGAFLAHNLALVEAVGDDEARLRRRDLLATADDLFAFYDERIPAEIADGRSFERWRRRAEADQPRLLFMTPETVRQSVLCSDQHDFPGELLLDGLTFALKYRFAPGEVDDGVSLRCPVGLLPQLRPHELDWLVPGLLEPLIAGLIRSLPKTLRRPLAPVNAHLPALLAALEPRARRREGLLAEALAEALAQRSAVAVDPSQFDPERLEARLRINVQVVDQSDRVMAQGRDVQLLQQELRARAGSSHEQRLNDRETPGLLDWPDQGVPERLIVTGAGGDMVGWPALRDDGDSVALVLRDDPGEARRVHRQGTQRLLLLHNGGRARQLAKRLPDIATLEVWFAVIPHTGTLADAILRAAADDLGGLAAQPLRTPAQWRAASTAVSRGLEPQAVALTRWVATVLERRARLMLALDEMHVPATAAMVEDLRHWAAEVIGGTFLEQIPTDWRDRVPIWLDGALFRIRQIRGAVDRDVDNLKRVHRWEVLLSRIPPTARGDADVVDFRYLLEEFRIAVFAQRLGTREPVSERRLERRWERLRRAIGIA